MVAYCMRKVGVIYRRGSTRRRDAWATAQVQRLRVTSMEGQRTHVPRLPPATFCMLGHPPHTSMYSVPMLGPNAPFDEELVV